MTDRFISRRAREVVIVPRSLTDGEKGSGDSRMYTKNIDGTERVALKVDTLGAYNSFSKEYTANVTDETIIEVNEKESAIVVGISIITESNSGSVGVDIGDVPISRLYASAQNRVSNITGSIRGAVGENVKITVSTGSNRTFVQTNYMIIEDQG